MVPLKWHYVDKMVCYEAKYMTANNITSLIKESWLNSS